MSYYSHYESVSALQENFLNNFFKLPWGTFEIEFDSNADSQSNFWDGI